ncbi:MAG: RNA polymerase sigma factor [Dehalococcoidia bacterium]
MFTGKAWRLFNRQRREGMNLPLIGRASAAAANATKPRAEHSAPSSPITDFSARYRQFYPKVFAYVYGRVQDKEVSLDIVSEVFERAFAKASSLRSDGAFEAWLFTIARNAIASHWRKEKPAAKALHSVAWEWETTQHHRDPEESLLEREQMAILLYHVHQLSQREQEILSLKFDAELSNHHIAQVMGTSEVNIRVTLYRALQKLRQRMKSVPQ